MPLKQELENLKAEYEVEKYDNDLFCDAFDSSIVGLRHSTQKGEPKIVDTLIPERLSRLQYQSHRGQGCRYQVFLERA
mgnify:CR=1 FL=1